MHIISRARLREFWERHPDAEAPLAAWHQIVSRARYTKPADVRQDFASASFIGDETVVFNIGGGKYRLVVAMVYATRMVYIKRVGTHAEYDRWTLQPGASGTALEALTRPGARVESKTMATASRLDFSKPHVLRTAAEYDAAVREIDALLAHGAPAPGSEDADRLQLLSVLVEVYENEHEPPMPEVSPPELVRFMLEQRGMTRADLAPLMGGKARVSEFFSGRRSLSIAQVQRLSAALRLPADLLIDRVTKRTPAPARNRKIAGSLARSTSVRALGTTRTSTKKRKKPGNPRGGGRR